MMTIEEKNKILKLRAEGIKLKEIIVQTKLSYNAVKCFLNRTNKNIIGISFCKECGKPMYELCGARQKQFCSELCRTRWWNKHPEQMKNRKETIKKCEWCGKEFLVYGNSKKRFCCKSCARFYCNKNT